jgi:tetratricopeptide (TPR) repeat protein
MKKTRDKLNGPDEKHLRAAEGWLGLGSWLEANEELERITPRLRGHPDVLQVRYDVYAKAKKWEMAVEIAQVLFRTAPSNPFDRIRLAYALHELKRTKEAWDVLLPVAEKFPGEYVICYNLACYACQLGDRKEAFKWLERAIDLSDTKEVKLMALDDPDLEPLWVDISEI